MHSIWKIKCNHANNINPSVCRVAELIEQTKIYSKINLGTIVDNIIKINCY